VTPNPYAEVIAQYNGNIVNEARTQSFCMTQNYSADLIWRLADEIERLRARLAELEAGSVDPTEVER
jgi:hypothetical protein